MTPCKSIGVSLFTLATVIASQPAVAQTAESREEAVGVRDIIVTAQKREQNTIDVPISLAALGAEKLDTLQINELRDFVGQVPNLFVNNFNGRSDTVRLFIRGIGQNDVTLTQDPSVGLYVDGVYVGTTVGAAFESEDLERVEVLRGPQGSLYGRNTTGGAVNIITAKPQLDGFHAKGSLTYGNFDDRRGSVMLNAPLGGNVAVRLTGLLRKRDGLQENTGLGRDFAEVNHAAFRGAIRIKPTDALTIDYAFDYSHNKDTGTLTVPTAGAAASFPIAAPFPIPGTFGLATGLTSLVNTFSVPSPFAPGRPESAQALRPILQNNGKVSSHSLTLEYEASDALTLRSITGHRRINNFQGADNLPVHQASIVTSVIASVLPTLPVGTVLNVIGPNGAAYTTDDIHFKSTSEEIQALGKIGDTFEYVMGGYYYQDSANQNVIGGAIGSGPLILPNFTTVRNKSYAAFGELTFHPGGNTGLSITIGGRYSHDKRAATRINERSVSFAALGGFTADNCAFFLANRTLQTCTPGGVVAAASYSGSFNNFSPSLTVAYKVNDALNLYAKYVRGYKSGGTSQRSANPINFAQGFQPEKVTSFEAGLKGKFLDNHLNASVAGFYMKLNRLQASVQTGATAGDRDFIGINGNEIYGVEFDLTAALTRELSLGVSGALLKATIGERSASVLLDTGVLQVQNFISDQTSAPKSSFNVNADYNRDLNDDWAIGFHSNLSYQSSVETSTNVLDNRTIAGKALVDATMTLTRHLGDNHELSLRFWGKNLFDKDYRTVNFGSFAFSGATTVSEFGEPRTYGATILFRY